MVMTPLRGAKFRFADTRRFAAVLPWLPWPPPEDGDKKAKLRAVLFQVQGVRPLPPVVTVTGVVLLPLGTCTLAGDTPGGALQSVKPWTENNTTRIAIRVMFSFI